MKNRKRLVLILIASCVSLSWTVQGVAQTTTTTTTTQSGNTTSQTTTHSTPVSRGSNTSVYGGSTSTGQQGSQGQPVQPSNPNQPSDTTIHGGVKIGF
jgi:hypothetical protein